jgi:lipid A 3-O-deacylase PagL
MVTACNLAPPRVDPWGRDEAAGAGVPVTAQEPAQQAAAAPEPSSGASHENGKNMMIARGHYSVPVLGKSIYWDGNGEDDNYGLGLYAFRFVNDGVAIGIGSNASVWMQSGRDAFNLEGEVLLRWYPFDQPRFYIDITGGGSYATKGIPTGGTQGNWTFGWGVGYDFPVGKQSSLMVGGLFHHTSNALGRDNDRNPSQNEGRFYIGYAWNF